jgi:hypothetical protein
VSGSQQDFIATFGPLANDVAKQTGLDPSVVLGQMAQETGYGSHISGNGTNPWGISAPGRPGVPAVYPSIQDGAQAYISLMKGRYSNAAQQSGPNAQAAAISSGGYGPNQGYGAQVAARANTVRQAGFNAPTDDDIAALMDSVGPKAAHASTTVVAPNGGPTDADIAALMDSVGSKSPAAAPASPASPAPSTLGPQAENWGIPRPPTPSAPSTTTAPPTTGDALSDVPSAMWNALKRGYDGDILSPQGHAAVDKVPYLGSYEERVGLPVANFLLNTPGALYGAAQAGVAGVGNAVSPGLGRDLAAGMEGVPAAIGLSNSGVPEGGPKVTLGSVAKLPGDVATAAGDSIVAGRNMLQGAIDRRAAPLPADFKAAPFAPDFAPSDTTTAPSSPTPNVGNRLAAQPPQPQGAGAQATPASAITSSMTPGDMRKAEQSQLNQTAADRADPQGNDLNTYVPGVVRTRAARELGNPTLAIDEKASIAADPAFKAETEKLALANNGVLLDHYHDAVGAGDPKLLENLKEQTDDTVKGALNDAFQNKTPVKASDVQSLADTIDKMLASGTGKRSEVVPVLRDVRASLFDKNGNLETDPEVLYGARQNITDKLSAAGRQTPGNQLAKLQLMEIKDQLDPVISSGAAKFPDYLAAVKQASQPYEAMNYLQSFLTGPGKLTDPSGLMQFGKVQRMLDQTVAQRAKPGFTAAQVGPKALTGDQMQRLFDMRNELAANHYKDQLARTKGSDSFQQFNAASRVGGPVATVAKTLGNYAIHAGIAHFTGGIGNAIYAGHVAARNANKLAGQAATNTAKVAAYRQSLLPPPGGYALNP